MMILKGFVFDRSVAAFVPDFRLPDADEIHNWFIL